MFFQFFFWSKFSPFSGEEVPLILSKESPHICSGSHLLLILQSPQSLFYPRASLFSISLCVVAIPKHKHFFHQNHCVLIYNLSYLFPPFIPKLLESSVGLLNSLIHCSLASAPSILLKLFFLSPLMALFTTLSSDDFSVFSLHDFTKAFDNADLKLFSSFIS